MLIKLFKQIFQKKLIVGIGLVLIITASYFIYQGLTKDQTTVQYVTTAVERSTLITSVEGSGQVSVSDQVDIKPKVSNDVVYVAVIKGQEVKTGTLLLQMNADDAQKAVRDAQTSLETANLELDKLLEPVDKLDLLKAENNLAKAKESKQKAEDNIIEGYEDAFNTMTNAFLDLPTLITGIRDVLYSYKIAESETMISNYQWNTSVLINSVDYDNRYKLEKFIDSSKSAYKIARAKYDDNFENYKNASRYSDKETIEILLEETLETVRAMAEVVKNETNMLDYWVDYRSGRDLSIYPKVTEYQSDIKSYTSKTNSHLTNLLNIQRSLQDDKESVLDAERSIEELELSFTDLKAGADELDIRAKKITVQQKEDALLNAQQDLANYYIRAPFDGIIAEINVKKGESISSANVVATLITKQQLAEITLNEVDIAQVEVGQKATITFDAVDDLTITGEVIEVDTLGQVNQGVVTYDAKIVFSTQDERVRPGMSISVAIITNFKQNILIVPNAAIKYQGDIQYVEILSDDNTIIYQQIEIGISNDTHTEIINGVEEGKKVISSQTTDSSISNNSGGLGGSGKGMDMMKMMR